jgi:predicted AlkP superfamily pyrophosphatase or phosphodiesterase
MKKPVLSIFSDGLRYDSLKYMPFLSSLNSVPLKTILGYSIACHPSMYTGLYPDRHKICFHWIYSPESSPYKIFKFFPHIFPFSNPFCQAVISHFYAKLFLKNNAFMGYSKILNLPMKHWNKLEANESKYWDEDEYIGRQDKTIFEILRGEKVKYYISGMYKPNLGKLDSLGVIDPKSYQWIYYFTGETDQLSHKYTQQSEETQAYLKKLDEFIAKRYDEFVKTYGAGRFTFIFWSDHGHIPTDKRINLYEEFKKQKYNLNKIFHIIDSTTVRFWVKNSQEDDRVNDVMFKIKESTLVKAEDYNALHLPSERKFYGDFFYYLKGGAVFNPTIHGFGGSSISMHGYHPDEDGNLGVFVTDREIKAKQVDLPDVFASTVAQLGLDKYTQGIDGSNKIT